MKLFWHYGKTFAALLLISLLLLMGQGVCDLTLPSLMGKMIQNGMGADPGAPEALSLQGMTLLQCFMTDENHRQMTETYLTFEPESSEARRLSEKYPGAVEQPICALREGLPEEQLTVANEIYEKASYALLLYLQQERDAGNLEDLSQRPIETGTEEKDPDDPGEFRDNLRDDLGQAASLPDGVLGTMPEGALFKLPTERGEEEEPEASSSAENAGGMLDSQEQTFGKSPAISEEDAAEREARANSRPFTVQDVPGVDIELLYTLLPRLGRTEQSVFTELISSAEQGNPTEIRQAANAFKILFYREIGLPTNHIQLESEQNAGWKLLGTALLGMLFAVLAILLLSRIVTLMGEQLCRDLNGGEAVLRTVEKLKRGLPLSLCALCTVPIWLVGSAVLAMLQDVPVGWRIAVAVLAAAGIFLLLGGILEKPLRKSAEMLFRRQRRLGWLFPLSVTFLTWLLNLLCALMLSAGVDFGVWTVFVQYALQMILALFMAGLLKVALAKAKELEANLK